MDFIFTDHAVEQYVTRVDPTLSLEDAKVRLEQYASTAVKLEEKTRTGDTQFIVKEGVVFITKPEKGKQVVVTIIPQDYVLAIRAQKRLAPNHHATKKQITLNVHLDVQCMREIDQSKVELLIHQVVSAHLQKAAQQVCSKNPAVIVELAGVGIVR